MSADKEERINQLLRDALPPAGTDAEAERDVWPDVLKRIGRDEEVARAVGQRSAWMWFDVALLAGLAVLGVSFPAAIPLLLYYL
jgi:hypothetical protein